MKFDDLDINEFEIFKGKVINEVQKNDKNNKQETDDGITSFYGDYESNVKFLCNIFPNISKITIEQALKVKGFDEVFDAFIVIED